MPTKPSLTCANQVELDIMKALLKEVRMAMKNKRTVSIMVDPFSAGKPGAFVFASSDPAGRRYTIEKS